MRIRVPRSQSISSWLSEVQQQQLEIRKYEYSPLAEVQQWSGIARGAGKRCSEAPKNWRQWLSVCLADHQRELAKEETRRADQFVNFVSSNPAGRRAMKENLP